MMNDSVCSPNDLRTTTSKPKYRSMSSFTHIGDYTVIWLTSMQFNNLAHVLIEK